ncbi:MAG: hypothetical protein F4052_08545 [Dehalococcoidia bacterium]|nr:hypothetical protein [Dehalococcoidia bacterium]MYK26975.1 hypothetical protein [Dehalococcoidia bacterium]
MRTIILTLTALLTLGWATATAEPAPAITVYLDTSTTAQPVMIVTVEANHPIPAQHAIVFVAAQGLWHGLYSARPLTPGEPSEAWHHRIAPATWQDAEAVKLRTLAGRTIREWTCAQVADPHALWGEWHCAIAETRTARSLRDADDPDLWAYLVNGRRGGYGGIIQAHVRAVAERAGSVTVKGWGADVSVQGRTHPARPLWDAGEVQRLTAAGGHNLATPHAAVSTLTVSSSGLGLLRCERHADSTGSRSVWACEVW